MEFLEIPLFDDDVFKMFIRFGFNLLFLFLIARFAILTNPQNREFAFTAGMLNITVFFICFALKKLELGIGMALGGDDLSVRRHWHCCHQFTLEQKNQLR